MPYIDDTFYDLKDSAQRKAYFHLYNKLRPAGSKRKTPAQNKADYKVRKLRLSRDDLGWCFVCADMPWRRPQGRKCDCGECYAAEVVAVPLPTPQSCGNLWEAHALEGQC